MALQKRGEWWYSDSQADIRDEILRYSQSVTYLAHHYANAVCTCGGKVFSLLLDCTQGAAVRVCAGCKAEQPIGDSDEYLEEAELEEAACACGEDKFEITVGV